MALLGNTLRYSVDLGGAGCGCNAAFYLTSMGHNPHKSECFDYYCDANNVCGQTCAEIDIQEANLFAFHATLHGANDSFGAAEGEGGGGPGWSGPRDWDKRDYGPGAKCVDSTAPYEVAVSFPTDKAGSLEAMWISLSQVKEDGGSCRISLNFSSYEYMSEMAEELKRGMTPIISYWADNDMLWLDGRGDDHKGPCKKDNKKKCSDTVRFFNFSIAEVSDEDTPTISNKTTTTTQKPVSDDGAWNGEASDSSTSSSEALEQPSSTTTQAASSLGWDWDADEGDDDGQLEDSSATDEGNAVVGGECVEFDNWRKAAVGGRAVQMNLGAAAYGVQTPSWPECRSMCAKHKDCKQVVFYKPDRTCFATREAQGEDQDNMGGSNYDFISAHCNNACQEFNNWRKSEAGEEIALGTHEYGAETEDWPTCRDRCGAEKECRQVVYYRPERKCFGMSGRGDGDQDNLGGQNSNFVSAHCHHDGAASGAGIGGTIEELTSGMDAERIVMQKKFAGLPGPAPPSDHGRWALACGGVAAVAVLAVCASAAAGARRRRVAHAAPVESLRGISSLGEVASEEDGLMGTRTGSERLLASGRWAPMTCGALQTRSRLGAHPCAPEAAGPALLGAPASAGGPVLCPGARPGVSPPGPASWDGGCAEAGDGGGAPGRLPLAQMQALVLSQHYWPSVLSKADNPQLKLPPTLEEALADYASAFAKVKANRAISWKKSLGLVEVSVQLADRTLNVEVTPVQVAILECFSSGDADMDTPGAGSPAAAGQAQASRRSLQEVAAQLQLPEQLVRKRIGFWVAKGVLREVSAGVFETQESLSAADGARHAGGGHLDEDGERSPEQSAARAAAGGCACAAEVEACEAFIQGMLTHWTSLPLGRIHNFLQMFMVDPLYTHSE
ncbi:unnamed protein product, partial [Prorocentrum cordatum]